MPHGGLEIRCQQLQDFNNSQWEFMSHPEIGSQGFVQVWAQCLGVVTSPGEYDMHRNHPHHKKQGTMYATRNIQVEYYENAV